MTVNEDTEMMDAPPDGPVHGDGDEDAEGEADDDDNDADIDADGGTSKPSNVPGGFQTTTPAVVLRTREKGELLDLIATTSAYLGELTDEK